MLYGRESLCLHENSCVLNQRLPLADIVKGIAVIRMIMIHLLDVFAVAELSANLSFRLLLLFAGPPGAALFMLVMGYFLAKSPKTLKVSLKHGFKLVFWGLLLNAGLNAHLFYKIFSGAIEANPLHFLFGVDIFFLAGLSLILIALLKQIFKANLWAWTITILVVASSGNLMSQFTSEADGMQYIQAFFIGNASWSYFPLLPWAAYPLTGYFFYLLDQKYQIRHFSTKGLFYISFSLLIITLIGLFPFSTKLLSPYGTHGLIFMLWLVAMCGFWIGLVHLAFHKSYNKSLFRYFSWAGRHITNMYVIQWLLIGNIGTLVYKTQSLLQLAGWFLFITLLSSLLTYFWLQLKTKLKKTAI